jgi:hypothetical protein
LLEFVSDALGVQLKGKLNSAGDNPGGECCGGDYFTAEQRAVRNNIDARQIKGSALKDREGTLYISRAQAAFLTAGLMRKSKQTKTWRFRRIGAEGKNINSRLSSHARLNIYLNTGESNK